MTSTDLKTSTWTSFRALKFALAALAVAGGAGCSSTPPSANGGRGGTSGSGGKGTGGAEVGTGGASWTGGSDSATDSSANDGGLVVPAVLEPPAGTRVAQHLHAIGAQVYVCTASGGADGGGADAGATTYTWTLKAPDATLYDAGGAQVATHSQGPTWTSIVDGSTVVGAKIAEAASPLSDAIPWLLLRATSTSGSGIFTNVTFIQRVNTMKGKEPATGCDGTATGTEARVDYTADYYFHEGGATVGDAAVDATLG